MLGIGGRAGGFASVCKEYNNHYKRRRFELATENKELEWNHEIELVAICDNNKAALENVADVRNLHDVKQYLDYKEMLDNEEIDMVFVGTASAVTAQKQLVASFKGGNQCFAGLQYLLPKGQQIAVTGKKGIYKALCSFFHNVHSCMLRVK